MNQYGSLTAGYGGDPGSEGTQIGPELGFGWTVGDALKGEQILLIKIGWGGRSLAENYRPPSSQGTTGLYYAAMLADLFKTLDNLEHYFPDYPKNGKYELAGFAWHQGWNDGCDANMTAEYEYNLANLIRDIRIDLGVPNLPVSIGVSGMVGYNPGADTRRDDIIAAQFAVANATKYPDFSGTVAAVETRPFYRPPIPASPGDQIYHWNNNCESYWLIGQAMGNAMLDLLNASQTKEAQSLPLVLG
jgi:alpha-galactosidase